MARGDFTMIENPVPWPGGARCAVSFTWDMDADSILHLAHPDDADTRVATMTDLRFGAEVAVPRICRVFESYGLKVTFFVPPGASRSTPLRSSGCWKAATRSATTASCTSCPTRSPGNGRPTGPNARPTSSSA